MLDGKMNGSAMAATITTMRSLIDSATNTESAFIMQDRMIRFTWLDYFFFVALLGLSTFIGYYYGFVSKHKQDNTAEYILGGQSMKILPIATSLVASHISGQTLLGIPVEVYSNGTQYIIFIVSAIALGLALSYVYLPLFFNLKMTSSFQYLERRFGRTVRVMSSAIYVFKSLCFTPLVVYVPALALSQVTGYKLHLMSPIICAVCVFYTTFGGLRAVVWTDFIQFVIIICGVIAVILLGTFEIGSFSEVFAAADRGGRLIAFEFDPNPLVRSTFWTVSLGLTINWISGMGVGQTNLQRFLSVPNLKAARRSVVIFITGMILIKVLTIYIGLCLYAKYEHCDPVASGVVEKSDQILPHYVTDVGGKIPGLPGLFIAGIFAAGLSSMSSSMNTLSGVIYDDFIKPHYPKATEKQASNIMKWTVVILGIIVTALVFVVERLGPVFQIGISIGSLAGGAFLGIFTVGMTSRTANTKGIMVGSAVSILVVSTILVGAQIHHVSQAPTLLTQTDQCDGQQISNATTTPAPTVPSAADNTDVFWLFRLSFMYYSLVGLTVMVIVSHIVSRLTGGDSQNLDESLLLTHFQSDEYRERMSKLSQDTKYIEVNQNIVELKDFTQKQKEISQEDANRV